jgi:ParB family transcriptional regulator, chromosome partitioning protein
MPNQRGLGRGFESLIPTQIVEEEFDPTAQPTTGGARVSGDRVQDIDPALIDPNPHQPRQTFDEEALQALAASIQHYGIVQPLVVTKNGDRYELIAGERRLRASKLVALSTVPVIIRTSSEQEKLELALIENLQREDLNPIETATSYRKLIDQFNLSYDEIAARVGKAATTIVNSTRLLNLPLEAKRAVVEGTITEGHARQILAVPAEKQLELLGLIIKNGWTVRQTEAFVRDFKTAKGTVKTATAKSAETNDLTKQLTDFLGTKVTLQRTAKGGRLMIEYYSDEELERIYQAIKHDH